MFPILRLAIALPFVLCLVSFVLSNLTLFAGHQKGFMEDYAIVRLNTSMIGENILKTGSSNKGSDKSGSGSLLDELKDKWHDIKDDAKGKVNDIAGNIVGNLADELGVAEWYSLHVMNSCEGNFGPNATAFDFQLNVTNCTNSSPAYRFNLTEILDHELSIGPFNLNLAKINWPDSIQDKIDNLNDAMLALFIFYVLGVGFSGIAMFACIPAFLIPEKKIIVLANFAVSSLAAGSIALGSIVASITSSIGARAINKAGRRVGVFAEKGHKFCTLSWVAAGLMVIVTLFWAAQVFLIIRRHKKQQKQTKEVY